MTYITAAMLCATYWPFGSYSQNHAPELPLCGTTLTYNRVVDLYWALQPPYHSHDICALQQYEGS